MSVDEIEWLEVRGCQGKLQASVTRYLDLVIELVDNSYLDLVRWIDPSIFDNKNRPIVNIREVAVTDSSIVRRKDQMYILAILTDWTYKKLQINSWRLKKSAWQKAIEMFRREPRGIKHWKWTNQVLDEILRNKLGDAPILKYRPIGWVKFLFRAYFILRTHYWFNFYNFVLIDPRKHLEFSTPLIRNLSSTIDIWVPFYLRIIALLLRIIIDRVGLPEYEKLPKIPPHYLMDYFVEFDPYEYLSDFKISHTLHPMTGPFASKFKKVIDEITNNAAHEIFEFFQDARGAYEGFREMILHETFLPVPFSDTPKMMEFVHSLWEEFSDRFFMKTEIKKHPLKTIMGEIKEQKVVEYGFMKFLDRPAFKKEILPRIVEFLKGIYIDLVPSTQRKIVKDCDLFYYFFKHSYVESSQLIVGSFDLLEVLLAEEGIDPDLLQDFLYVAGSNQSLADPLTADQIFRYSLDLFQKPFIQDRLGRVFFSILWLFDSLIYHLTKKLSRGLPSKVRGLRSESYIAYYVANFVQDILPEAPFEGPYKIILVDENLKKDNAGYQKLKKNVIRFKYPIYEIAISSPYHGFNYVEFDFCFLFYDILFVIEVKDNLFWDLRDLPTAHVLWGIRENKKLKQHAQLFQRAAVRAKLKKVGIKYKKIECMVISHRHIMSTELHSTQDLLQALVLIHTKKNNVPADIIVHSEVLNALYADIQAFMAELEVSDSFSDMEKIKIFLDRQFKKFKKDTANSAANCDKVKSYFIIQTDTQRFVILYPYSWPPYPWSD